MRIAVDIDDTLWKLVRDDSPRIEGVGAVCACGVPLKQEVDKLLIEFVHSLIVNGDKVFIWSAGGVDHARNFIKKFAPAWELLVEVIPKEEGHDIDITIDDQLITLGKINLRVWREHSDHFAP